MAGKSVAEHVRVYRLPQPGLRNPVIETHLYASHRKASPPATEEQCRSIVTAKECLAPAQPGLDRFTSLPAYRHHARFAALAGNPCLPCFQINVDEVHARQFGHPQTRRIK